MGLERMLKGAMTNKYVLYVVLFIAITNVVGYLASQDYDSLVFFVITGFLTSYFSDNMTVILLAALVVSNVFLASRKARSVREGMKSNDKDDKDDKDKKDKKNKKDKKDKKDKDKKDKDDEGDEGDKDGGDEDTEKLTGAAPSKKDTGNQKEKYSGMQKLSPAAIGEDINVKATNDANFGEVESQLSASDMNDLNGQTQNLKNAQADLHRQIKAIGPLMDSANKMMQGMGGIEGLSGMLNQANQMMGSISPMLDKLNMGGKQTNDLADAAPVMNKAGKEGAAIINEATM